jgi:DNA topoisomerase-1
MNIYVRKKLKDKFIYIDNQKKVLKDKKKLDLIKSYVLPPAWTDVKINLVSKDIFATGYDQAGRKQYKYTRSHDKRVSKQKFCNLCYLGSNLGNIKKDIQKHLKKENFNDSLFYISIILKIILLCNFRIGQEDNIKKYNSYGISTIQKKHIKFNKKDLIIEFNGKKGVFNSCIINEPLIYNIMKKIYKIRSNSVFSINNKQININDVNQYLQSFDKHISSKDFRTWNANIITINQLLKLNSIHDSFNKRKKVFKEIVKNTAIELHHTETICKQKYLMMDLYELYLENPDEFYKYSKKNKYKNLNNSENLFMNYLEKNC